MDLFLLLSLLALALYFAGFILLSSKKKEDIKIYVLGVGLSLIGFLLFNSGQSAFVFNLEC